MLLTRPRSTLVISKGTSSDALHRPASSIRPVCAAPPASGGYLGSTPSSLSLHLQTSTGLKKQGVQVERYNLSQQPSAFASNVVVKDALNARGNDCLPMVVVDDRIAVEGAYPSRDTLAALAGVVVRKLETAPVSGGCCGPATKAPNKSGSSCC